MRIHAAGVNPYETYMRAGTYPLKPPLPYLPDLMAPASLKLLARVLKKRGQTTAYTPGGPPAVHMRNTPSHSKRKYIRFQ